MTIKLCTILMLGCLLLSLQVEAREFEQSDIVTMNNGDIMHGTVAQEAFTLDTAFGRLAIPYSAMARLETEKEVVHIETRQGERISGTLSHTTFPMLRLLDPTVPLHREDIAMIEFGQWPSRATTSSGPDRLELENGDWLRIRLTTDELLVKNERGITLTGRAQIHTMDLVINEDEERPRVLLRLNGSAKVVSGQLMNSTLTAISTYSQPLVIPLPLIGRLTINQFHQDMDIVQSLTGMTSSELHFPQRLQDRLADGTPGPELLILRGGRFHRGDLQGDGDADEQPATEIDLTRPFAISRHEVTFAEYDRFCEATRRQKPDDEGWGRHQRPVINVNWNDAVAYTQWLSKQTGKSYRLPTDAEWEYAARGGSKARFWWGDEKGVAQANCSDCGGLWDGEKSAPVGHFPPNPFGLYDITGNVWEWVADCYHDKFAEAPSDGTAIEKEGCGKRVIRGGAWSFPAQEMRSANRWRDFPSRTSDDTGFRVVRQVEY